MPALWERRLIMNPDTNELRNIETFEEERAAIKEGFISLPKKFERAAKLKLNGRKRAIVSKTSGGKLSKWAVKKRRQQREQKKMITACNAYYAKRKI